MILNHYKSRSIVMSKLDQPTSICLRSLRLILIHMVYHLYGNLETERSLEFITPVLSVHVTAGNSDIKFFPAEIFLDLLHKADTFIAKYVK